MSSRPVGNELGQIKRLQLAIEQITSGYRSPDEEDTAGSDDESEPDTDKSWSLSDLESSTTKHTLRLSSSYGIADLTCRKKNAADTFEDTQDPFPLHVPNNPVPRFSSTGDEKLGPMVDYVNMDIPKIPDPDPYRGNCLIKKPLLESPMERMTTLPLSQILSAAFRQEREFQECGKIQQKHLSVCVDL